MIEWNVELNLFILGDLADILEDTNSPISLQQ